MDLRWSLTRLPHGHVRVGTEHEKLAIRVGSRERATYEDIAPILRGLVERYGWDAKMQGDNIFGALVRISSLMGRQRQAMSSWEKWPPTCCSILHVNCYPASP